MVAHWAPDGAARKALMAGGTDAALVPILTGLGSLSYGEMAGERMKLGLMIHDPEEEHDCFSDNTHNAHYYDALGIRNVYLGSYKRPDGIGRRRAQRLRPRARQVAGGRHAHARGARRDDEADGCDREARRGGEAYDQMIGEGNDAGNALLDQTIQALIAQSKEFERISPSLDSKSIEFEGSDSLDNPVRRQVTDVGVPRTTGTGAPCGIVEHRAPQPPAVGL